MKKLLLLSALIVSFSSFGQSIVQRVYKPEVKQKKGNMLQNNYRLISTDTLDITKIKDEFIQVVLRNGKHLLSITDKKGVYINHSWNKEKWNVLDGKKLIALNDEIDILNFFHKYGFEFFKSSSGGSASTYSNFTSTVPNQFGSLTSYSFFKQVLIFKNNNN